MIAANVNHASEPVLTKVFDFHLHVGTRDHWNPWIMEFFARNNPRYTRRFSESVTPESLMDYLRSQGVDRAVVLSEYAPLSTGVVPNEFTAEFCRGREELIPFGSVRLHDEVSPSDQAEHAVRSLGVRGFKMLPTYAHFYPNDRSLFPFYETVQSLGVPLQFHTGTSVFKGSLVKYGDPLLLDDVAEAFGELQIVLDHGGRPFWYDRADWMITRHRNVHIGLTGVPAKRYLEHFPNLVRYPERYIFGSDWPGVPDIRPFVEKVLDLPLSDDIKAMLLWENAVRLLQLP
jgi:hypothetical protein